MTARVVIVGGGLAGMAAAIVLAERGLRVTLLEAKRKLGGRAGSWIDRETGELVDHCQHVAMGCCTNYLDFCRRVAIESLFARYRSLHFFSADGKRSDFVPSGWLPAPLHLLPALRGLTFLSAASRKAIERAMLRLARMRASGAPSQEVASDRLMLEWLREQTQPQEAIDLFWSVVLVSALGDTLDRVSVSAARKVFVDGFMGARGASDVLVPTCSLGELYDVRAAQKLRSAGVEIRHGAAVDEVVLNDGKVVGIKLAGGEPVEADFVMLAVAWRRVAELLPDGLRKRLPAAERAAAIKPSPITGVHLWFDRPILSLPHAVLVGRLSQWVFTRTQLAAEGPGDAEAGRASRMQSEHYYQIVISGSHDLAGRDRAEVIAEVVADLAAVLPAVRNATLLRSRMITEPESVFSMEPGIEDLRPSQRTGTPGLVLAGDWTKTGWPATMEGAVRSGYLAAETILADVGRPERIVVPDLPRGWLARAVLR